MIYQIYILAPNRSLSHKSQRKDMHVCQFPNTTTSQLWHVNMPHDGIVD